MTGTPPPTAGIHHVTAITGDPVESTQFYTDTLGLRLVKRTVNFDDPTTYHLYFGDTRGAPGSVFTVFPMPNAGQGSVGAGQVTLTWFAIPVDSRDFWEDRLARAGATTTRMRDAFDDTGIRFEDPSGLRLALIERSEPSADEPWTAVIDREYAIRGFAGITIMSRDVGSTSSILERLGFQSTGAADDRHRFQSRGDRARTVALATEAGPPGSTGVGTVHHVAFRVPDPSTQRAWRETLLDDGYRVTDVRDRLYLQSIYFREPGGVLFELATDGPGFTVDEDREALGERLQLPPWLDDRRAALEAQLPPLVASVEESG